MSSTKQPWFQLTVEEALRDSKTKTSGLTASEASSRLAEHGLNRLTPPKKRGPLLRFLLQFHNVLIYVLLAAAGVTALLGHWVDTWVIVGVVVVNAVIGFIQEGKAEKSLDAIRRMLSLHATVVRDGQRQEVDAEHSCRAISFFSRRATRCRPISGSWKRGISVSMKQR